MNHGILALESILSIGMLAVLVFWARPDYCADVFRSRMGELRDALLEATPTNPLDPAIPAYDLLRQAIEGLIERAGHLSLSRSMVQLRRKPQHDGLAEALEARLRVVDAFRRVEIHGFHRRMNAILLGHLLSSSPMAGVLFWPLATRMSANPTIARGLDRLSGPSS